VAGLVLGLAASGGWALGRHDAPDRTAVLPAAATGDWPAVLDGLDATRAEAFAGADVTRLDAVYAPGSPGLAADAALVRQLAAAGRTATGVRHVVRSVVAQPAAAGVTRLRVVDVLGPYEVRDAAGRLVQRVPGRGEAAHDVELRRTPQGWRLVRVLAA
jgi:hypothetical protein